MRYFAVVLFIVAFFASSFVQAEGENHLLKKVFTHSKNKQPQLAKEYLTKSSHALYDRMYAHHLTFLLPDEVNIVRRNHKNGFEYVQFTDQAKAADQFVIIAFQQEDGATKIDLPETFRIGFGEKWKEKLDMIEQTYAFTRQYYSEEQTIQLLKGLTQRSK